MNRPFVIRLLAIVSLLGILGALTIFSAFFYYVHYAGRDLSLRGCTDELALNFDPQAEVNAGTCFYPRTVISYERRARLISQAFETSGLIYWQNKFWTHNDYRDLRLYGFTFDAPLDVETIFLEGLANADWEEIAQDDNYLYIGDIGNNYGSRRELLFYKIEKKGLREGILRYSQIRYRYEDQTDVGWRRRPVLGFDIEAFLLKDGYIYIFTKELQNLTTRVYRIPNEAGSHVAVQVNAFNAKGMITGAMYLQEERLLALVGYNFPFLSAPFIWLFYDFEGDDFFGANKRRISLNYLQFMPLQIEAITTIDGMKWYLTNEQAGPRRPFRMGSTQMIHEIDLSSFLTGYFDALPTPARYYYRGFGALNDPANWFTNPNGAGRQAPDFAADSTSWHLTTTGTHTELQAWEISGAGSELIIGNGSHSVVLHAPQLSAETVLSENAALHQK